MIYRKYIIDEVIKSTLLTLALFAAFDLLIQGYNGYHNWLAVTLTSLVGCYYLFHKKQLGKQH